MHVTNRRHVDSGDAAVGNTHCGGRHGGNRLRGLVVLCVDVFPTTSVGLEHPRAVRALDVAIVTVLRHVSFQRVLGGERLGALSALVRTKPCGVCARARK